MGRVSPLAVAFVGLLAGCSGNTSLNRESYPDHLEYGQRKDLILPKTPLTAGGDPLTLPGPGQLDASIRAAATNPADKTLVKDAFDPAKASGEPAARLAELDKAMKTAFGKPSKPRVGPSGDEETPKRYKEWLGAWGEMFGANASAAADLEIDEATLQRGSKLYRRHCLHCHGLAGDGRGPTGPWVHPHPRDYRTGEFKFLSTATLSSGRKPRRDDIVRVLHQGIDGTSMPAFGLLPEHELRYLASYVIHLSIRGQAELEVMRALLGGSSLDVPEGKKSTGIEDDVLSQTAKAVIDWTRSNEAKPISPPASPEPTAESITKGHQLFVKAGCLGCHTDYGRQAAYKRDVWGTLARPYNLTTNTYRGGRRPLDLYWRFKGGINPSQMPSVSGVSDEDVWHLVNFVRAAPYPAMLPDDVRQTIYGPRKEVKQAAAK